MVTKHKTTARGYDSTTTIEHHSQLPIFDCRLTTEKELRHFKALPHKSGQIDNLQSSIANRITIGNRITWPDT
jgi:hypothetical protein